MLFAVKRTSRKDPGVNLPQGVTIVERFEVRDAEDQEPYHQMIVVDVPNLEVLYELAQIKSLILREPEGDPWFYTCDGFTEEAAATLAKLPRLEIYDDYRE